MDRIGPFVGGGLGAFWGVVFKLGEGMFNVAWHGDVDVAVGIVPVEGEPAVEGTRPVDGGFIVVIEGGYKVLCVDFGEIFIKKSYTHMVKVAGFLVWRQRPVVNGAG